MTEKLCDTSARPHCSRTDFPVKIIINADDLGISPIVNEAILNLVDGHFITSATVIANGPAVEQVVRSIHTFPHCSFGAHLNLTEFKPLSRSTAAVLAATNGEMSRSHLERITITPKLLQAVYEEYSLQIEKLLKLGVPVSHIDSHQHAHTIPHLFPALKAVQRRFGIRKLRASRNIYSKTEQVSLSLLRKKQVFNWGLRTIYRSRVPDGFTDLPTILEMNEAAAQHYRTLEVMVHPGADNREKETAILQSQWMKSLPFAAKALSYLQL